MAQFTKITPVRREKGAIRTTGPGTTAQGGPGFKRDERSELFLTAVTHLHGKDTFYESADARTQRFVALVQSVAKSDPDWLRGFIPWLRDEAGIRTATVVAAVEYAFAKAPNARQVVARSFQRADEPAEALGYALSTRGRRIPKALKKGLADACVRLYGPMTVLKYDSQRATIRPSDVINLCHPKPKDVEQDAVFTALHDRRHGRAHRPATLEALPLVARDLAGESATWERASATGKVAWDEQIPTMGTMALLRNLRNFDRDGISDASVALVRDRLTSREAVRRARLFPLRFLSAWEALESVRWGGVLEQGLEHSLANVPSLDGHTLVLWDCSGSMGGRYNASSNAPWKRAGVFALGLAMRAERATVVAYSNNGYQMSFSKGGSLLRQVEQVKSMPGLWGGTNTWGVCAEVLKRDPSITRVVVVTDEQVGGNFYYRAQDFDALLGQRRAHVLNVAGYEMGSVPSDRVVAFGGFNDRAFLAIGQAEAGLEGRWPWQDGE